LDGDGRDVAYLVDRLLLEELAVSHPASVLEVMVLDSRKGVGLRARKDKKRKSQERSQPMLSTGEWIVVKRKG
jgi:hypothetical protein